MYGIALGLGIALKRLFSLYFKLMEVIKGVKDDSRSEIILAEGYSSSEIMTNLPLPALAVPSTNELEAPFPIPIEETLTFCAFVLTILMTSSVLLTVPSVNKNMNLGYPLIVFYVIAFRRG
jgi:hypothetical protein